MSSLGAFINRVELKSKRGLWGILFEDVNFSSWACYYCIYGNDNYEMRKYISRPMHYLIYGIKTGNMEDVVDNVKNDSVVSFVVYVTGIATIDNIDEILFDLRNSEKQVFNTIAYKKSNINHIILSIKDNMAGFHFKYNNFSGTLFRLEI